jgi:hypothetical protein
MLQDFKNKLSELKNLDQSSLDYYQDEYNKLTNLETIIIKVYDHEGNATKYHSLNIESLIFLVGLLQKKGL